MISEVWMRRVLWTAVVFNLGGALMLAFPASALGQLAGLPDAPAAYRVLVAMFVLLFGGMYAWLARQPVILRPMVLLGAIGKSAAFASVLVLWLMAEVPLRCVAVIAGDLVFAGLFLVWSVGAGQGAPASRMVSRGR